MKEGYNFNESNQEHLDLSGQRIAPKHIERIHTETQKQEIDEKEKDPRLETVLERINFDVLEKIFQDYATKSGLTGKINFLGRDRIRHFTDGNDIEASYLVIQNLIALSFENIKRDDQTIGLMILHKLCHEEAHAISRLKEVLSLSEQGNELNVKAESITSGYRQDTLLRAFNEGVVERLAQEVFNRYLQADPIFADDAQKSLYFERSREHPESLTDYTSAVRFVEVLSKRIAQEVGVSEQLVWQALIRGLLEGENFDDPQLQKDFEDMFPKDFLEKLKNQQVDGNYDELFSMINDNKLVQWFKRLLKTKTPH